MEQPVRILHFADLHIGMENYGRLDTNTGLNQRVVDFLNQLDTVVAYAKEHDADLVLFTGDAFRTRNPAPTYQREFALRIRELSEASIPTVLLVGNHDVPVIASRASSVEIFQVLSVSHVTVVSQPSIFTVMTKRGAVQIGAVPYPVRQRLLSREQYRRLSQDALDQKVTEMVSAIIEDLASQVNVEVPAILIGHFSVQNAVWGSERSIMIGRDVSVPLSTLANPVWDYVALGHIHQHQNLNPNTHPPVVYAGSLARVDFGEEKQAKGFCWVELIRGKTDWRCITVPARQFQTIRIDVRASNSPLDEVEKQVQAFSIKDAVVRLMIQMLPEQEPLLRDADLTPLLQDAFYIQINRDVDRNIRDRLAGVEPDEMTPAHLLKTYLETKGKSEEEVNLLVNAAETIFSEDVDDLG
jgi:exonuclease SbcD